MSVESIKLHAIDRQIADFYTERQVADKTDFYKEGLQMKWFSDKTEFYKERYNRFQI